MASPTDKDHELAVAALMFLMALGGWLLTLVPIAQAPPVAQADQEDFDTTDGSTVALGTEILSAGVDKTEFAEGRPGIHKDMPTKPLPGQRRPENTGRCINPAQLALNGGCWTEFLDMKPPCQGNAYEWRGRCYEPVYTAPRQPTSTLEE